MRILITNDDGILAPGLESLERIARSLADEVWVVAPENDQSGFAHSLTLHDPLRLRELDEKRYAVRGTPTDCVIMAVRQIMDEPPDLILSGVNAGQNAADDVTYSGTIAAAIEGTLIGVPSIALSQAFDWASGKPIPFATAEAHAPELIDRLMTAGIAPGTLININFPDRAAEAVEGISVCRQGTSAHGLRIDARVDSRRKPYYWLAYARAFREPEAGTDVHALQSGHIAVTPLKLDMTYTDGLGALEKALQA
ncbi:5'-nucleotidase SurE [Hartmannibacter diazotrophicus]|uniref:5'-nucleotidase SurE n=1 Tax=Hartmannibacter diazotrophicus TaxID=1482074 RepID=A0A2C9D6M5_9HYPH|nr:5'/3'-nucleotidase SurE [Hartmannibacter diazotrophicus]SON55957.1 5'-nucleotidase SurE [Hartmannibacter diazotrophicus]